ncbi:MAG TPA: hypothetical protein VFP72_21850 [Kineosporiaceae bacterium]|nr:hypothetical protein [Kineosporiaceae bacterium]
MSGDQGSLRRRYERLLRAYPATYRARHGQELVDTLLQTSAEGQGYPSVREAVALVVEGMRLRVRQAAAAPVSWWRDGLQLGVGVLAVSLLLDRAPGAPPPFTPFWLVMLLVAGLTLRGRVTAALPVALLAAFSMSPPLLHDRLPVEVNQLLGNDFGIWDPAAPYLVVAAGLLILTVPTWRHGFTRHPSLRAWSWWWLLAPLGLLVTWNVGMILGVIGWNPHAWRLLLGSLEVVTLSAGLAASILSRDLRWALAAAVYLCPGLVHLAAIGPRTPYVAIYTATLWGLTIASAALAGLSDNQRRAVSPPIE